MRPTRRSHLDKSKVDQYSALTEFKQVIAPFDGTITERKIDVGNLVTAGSGSTTTPLYRMAQTDPLRIFVDVPQSAAGELMNAGVPARDSRNRRRGRRVLRKNCALRASRSTRRPAPCGWKSTCRMRASRWFPACT